MTGHTLGPWRRGQDGNLRVYGPDGAGEHSGLIATVHRVRDIDLVASAPQMAAELTALRSEVERLRGGPRVVCLCGSTRFIETFATLTWLLERRGYIVLGCTLLPRWFCGVPDHFGEATGTKQQCDDLHKRKIDKADEVLVIDIGGYIGESTRSEIDYAAEAGKPVRYLSEDAALLAAATPPESR